MEYIEPFDFKKIFMEYFLGTPELLIFALVILISFASAKFGMSNRNFLLIMVISSIMFAAYLGEPIYLFVLIILGFVTFKSIGGLFR